MGSILRHIILIFVIIISSNAFANIFGEDNRKVIDTFTAPYNFIGLIKDESDGHCTGTLVSEDIIVTSAHCIFDSDTGAGYPDQYFYLNYQDGYFLGKAKLTKIISGSGWGLPAISEAFSYEFDFNKRSDRINDWAIARLDKPLGKYFGYFKVAKKTAIDVSSMGYSRDIFNKTGHPSVHKNCKIKFKEKSTRKIYYISSDYKPLINYNGLYNVDCDFIPGASGGPVFFKEGNDYFLLGINSAIKPKSNTHHHETYSDRYANLMLPINGAFAKALRRTY